MKQEKWFDRKFNFNNSQNTFPSIIERLSGTPIRLEEKLKNVPEKILTYTPADSWSIKENLGHLTDLEPLWQGRLDDILAGEIEMSPTDLQNNQTHWANHNKTLFNDLLAEFRKKRLQTVQKLQSLSEETLSKSALHPRLKTPMRTTDLFLFVAEHDDHHLARISELLRLCANPFSDQSLTQKTTENHKRVKFDFETYFTNGGSLTGKEFRLDIPNDNITDQELAEHIAKDLRLLMVRETKILNKEIINETHKRT